MRHDNLSPICTCNTCERIFGHIQFITPDKSKVFYTIPPDNGLLSNKTCTANKTENSPVKALKSLGVSKESSIIIAHLNINFLYNKFEGLKLLAQDEIDILVISETKLDDTYTTNQFMIEGFS